MRKLPYAESQIHCHVQLVRIKEVKKRGEGYHRQGKSSSNCKSLRMHGHAHILTHFHFLEMLASTRPHVGAVIQLFKKR